VTGERWRTQVEEPAIVDRQPLPPKRIIQATEALEGNGTMELGFIGWIVVGIVAGFLAEKIMGRNHGLLTNLIVGVIGALLGGFLAGVLNIGFAGWIGSIIVATLGAVVLLFLLGLVKRRG
jgi:uncharacterized membrane protein YeaQ/YmgE (transglycosylase-associated protein family)